MSNRIGVFGGTHFVGRHIVRSLLDSKYTVILMNRCESNMHLYPHLDMICIDRSNPSSRNISNDNLEFDCIIDTTCYPNHLTNTLIPNRIKTNYYVYISSASVYEWEHRQKFLKLNPHEVLPQQDYVSKKYICEGLIKKFFDPKDYLIIRPGYICGEYDYLNRFDYSKWPNVYWKDGGEELKDYDDVQQLSKWIVDDLISHRESGIVDTVGGEKYKNQLESYGWKI